MTKTLTTYKLNPKQELFCQYYVLDEETFGNATESYKKAYNITPKEDDVSVRAMASTLLTKQNIKLRMDNLLNEYINDTIVDRELALVIRQKDNLGVKVQAIREYNNLKQRTENKIELTLNKYEWNRYSDK